MGPRKNIDHKELKPINIKNVYLGTGILWFGWLGFNGGSELAINARSVNAVVCSNLAACAAAITWILVEMAFERKTKISLNGFCAGAITGLVAITPACGFVQPKYSVAIGFIGI